MSFYGNIKNTARTQFYFDRIYPNRQAMDMNAGNDGVFAGRFVLVEYEQDISADIFPQCYSINGRMFSNVSTVNVKSPKDPETEIAVVENGLTDSEYTIENINNGDIFCIPAGQAIHSLSNSTMYIRFKDTSGAYQQITQHEYEEWCKNYSEYNDKDLKVFLIKEGGVTHIYSNKSFIAQQCVAIPSNQNYSISISVEYKKAIKNATDETLKWEVLSDSDSIFVRNWNIDKSAYGVERTYDSTVWQKVYVGNKEQYIMVADLNTIAPRFTFTADAPSVTPIPIHYDPVNTNTNYNIHMQTPWGFRLRAANGNLKMPLINHKGQIKDDMPQTESTVKNSVFYPSDFITTWKGDFYDIDTEDSNEKYYSPISGKWNGKLGNTSSEIQSAVYVNRKGFNPLYISKSSDLCDNTKFGYDPNVNIEIYDKIALEPTGYSGRVYNDHVNSEGLVAQPDTQELVIMLPSLGDAISDIWDIVYGGRNTDPTIGRTHKRNLDINWEYANGIVKKEGLRAVTDDNERFNTSAVDTLAGCINSVHDLMGQIIVCDSDALDLANYEEGYIYQFKDGSYRRKAVSYTYDEVPYTYTKISLSEKSYAKGHYYYKDGENYFVCNDEDFDGSKEYYYKTVTIPEKYEVISLSEKPNYDLFYKTPNGVAGKPDYRIVTEVNEDIDYYSFSHKHPIKVTAFYAPYLFYYYDGDKNSLVLDIAETGTKDRAYVEITDVKQITLGLKERILYNTETGKYITGTNPENGESIEDDLTYIYCPGIFYHYSEEARVDENGNPVYDTDGNQEIAKTVKLETRTYDELVKDGADPLNDYRIIWAKPVEGGSGDWVMNPDGSYTTSSGVTNLDVDQMFKVKLIPLQENKIFYKGEKVNEIPSEKGNIEFDEEVIEPDTEEEENLEENPFVTTHVLEYIVLTEERLKKLYEAEFTGSETTAVVTDFFSLTQKDAGTFYAPNTFYYQTADGSYMVDRNESMTDKRAYYDSVTFSFKQAMKFYIPNKFYVIDPITGQYVIDKTKTFDSSKTYYKFNGGLYVIDDSVNVFAPHSEWNDNITQVPASVRLGLRTEHVTTKELDNFARQLNTIHGLILRVNKMLEIDDFDTRDRGTLQGCINIINDIINKFEVLAPNNFLIVDDYGRVNTAHWDTLQSTSSLLTKASDATEDVLAEGIGQDQFREVGSVEEMRGQWLTLYMKSTPKNPEFKIHHNFQKVTDTTSAINKNTDNVASGKASDKIDLYTPIVDKMGHVVGHNTETVTLPYGFKTIASGADSTSVDELDTSHSDIVAENTQDKFTINTGNKWIRTATAPDSDAITFAHALSPISSQANTKYGLVADETVNILDGDNTFEVPVFKFDEAGHIIFAETHTVTIPEVFESVKIVGGSTDTSDTSSTSGTITADGLKDTLNFEAGNQWLQMSHNEDTDTIVFKHYVKKFTEVNKDTDATLFTDLDNSDTFTVQEIAWDNAGHLTSSRQRTYKLQDGYKNVGVANSGASTTTTVAAAAGTLTAATHTDKFTIDTGNRWIVLTADETGKKVTISHAAPGTASTSKGDTSNQTPNFGATFKVLSAGIDHTGHVKDLNEHEVTIPLPKLIDEDTGNVVTGLSLTDTEGKFTLSKKNVGTLTLTGYTEPTTNEVKTLSSSDSINGAFSKVQSYLNSLTTRIDGINLTDTAVAGEFVSKVDQVKGKISVTRVAFAPSITITAGTEGAAPKVNVSVNGKEGEAQELTIASTGVYGVTKLSSATNSPVENVAATPKAVKTAYDLANGAIAKTAKFEYDTSKVATYNTTLSAITDKTLTVEQLMMKVATLEARIKALES